MAAPYLSRKEEKALASELAAYNKRIRDLSRQKRFDNVVLPPQIDIREAVHGVTSGRDLQRLRNTIARINNPKNLQIKTNAKGLKYTVATEKQLMADVAAANKQREKRRQELAAKPVVIGGKQMGTVGSFYPERLQEYAPLTVDLKNTPTQRSLKAKFTAAKKSNRKKQELLKENLLKSIENNLGTLGDTAALFVMSLSPQEIEDIFSTSDVLDFEFLYSLEQQQQRATQLENELIKYIPDDYLTKATKWTQSHYDKNTGLSPWAKREARKEQKKAKKKS